MLIRIPSGVKTEVSFGYDVATGKARFLGYRRSSYALALPDEICGTFDVVKPGYVGDYKTGHSVLGHASSSAQLKFGALCVDLLKPLGSGVTVEHVYVRGGAEKVSYDRAALSREQLTEFGGQLKAMVSSLREAQTGTRRYHEGLHCRHCHAFDWCPAKREMLSFLAGEVDLAKGYERTREIEQLAKRSLDRLKEIAQEQPISLGNGRYYGISKRNRFEEYVKHEQDS